MRKAMGIICYIIMLVADGVAGLFTWQAYSQEISYQKGFLLFMPVFIITYWFGTFFNQLAGGKDEQGKPRTNKIVMRILSWLSTLLSLALLGFWVFIYITKALYLEA